MLYHRANFSMRSCFSFQRMMNCYFACHSDRDQMAAAVEAGEVEEEAVEAHLPLHGVLLVARQKSRTSANIGYSRPSGKATLPKSSWPNIFQPEKRYCFFVFLSIQICVCLHPFFLLWLLYYRRIFISVCAALLHSYYFWSRQYFLLVLCAP